MTVYTPPTAPERAITLKTIITAISEHQAVLNADELQAVQVCVDGLASLDKALGYQLSFLANARYSDALATTQAAVVLVDNEHKNKVPTTSVAVVVASPYLAYAAVSQLFEPSSTAAIHPDRKSVV